MKVITAIGNTYINDKLKEYSEYEVIGKDIQYEEGILEILSERNDIEILLLSNDLPEEYNFYILIEKIQKLKNDIQMIIFLKEKNQDIENFLNSKEIYKIYYLNNIEEYFESLNFSKHNLNKKVIELKEIISQNITDIPEMYNKDNVKNIGNKYIEKDKKMQKKFCIHNNLQNTKIIAISGNYGSGKSIFSIILSKYFSKNDKKIVLIDLDNFNSSIKNILELNYNKNNFQSQYKIIKYNKNIDVIVDFKEKENKFNEEICLHNVNDFFTNLNNKYDYIIIDVSSNIKNILLKNILLKSDKIIYLLEPNILEITKGSKYLEIYTNDFAIDKSKIKVVFNKTNKYKIANTILSEIFEDFEIIGEIKYDEKYNLLINQNNSNFLLRKDYEKICENI